MGVVGGGEASAVAQPATGGKSRREDWRCFRRLEQEDQRLKNRNGRWMDIVRSLQLESFKLTKLCVLSRATSRRRPDQAVPATLEEEDERLKVHAGRWI